MRFIWNISDIRKGLKMYFQDSQFMVVVLRKFGPLLENADLLLVRDDGEIAYKGKPHYLVAKVNEAGYYSPYPPSKGASDG